MLREQDLRVNVTLNEASLPDVGVVFELGVVARSKDDSNVGPILITQASELEDLVAESELPELQGGFSRKPIHLWTVQSAQDISQLSESLGSSVKTVLFTAATSEFRKDVNLSFDGVKVYTIGVKDPQNQEDLADLAVLPHVCAFLDPELEGKALYTFSELLASYPIVGNQMNIRSETFQSAFQTYAMRDALMTQNFSFFLQSQTGAFLWDVYAGGKQIQAVYSYLVLQNQVSASIAEWLKRGQPYSDDALLNLKGEVSRDLGVLKTQNVIAGYDISLTWVKNQAPEDKVKGIIRGFAVDFNEQYRIAEVNILINGEV